MVEEWRATHHPDYEVSNLGRVRSWAKQAPWHYAVTTPRVLKQFLNKDGYPTTGIAHKTTPIHKLVAAAFIGPCPDGQQVMHKDDDQHNACADNLEYGTALQNIQACVVRGRRRYLYGEDNPSARLTRAQVQEIRQRASRETQLTLAKEFGVHQVTISKIVLKQRWRSV